MLYDHKFLEHKISLISNKSLRTLLAPPPTFQQQAFYKPMFNNSAINFNFNIKKWDNFE